MWDLKCLAAALCFLTSNVLWLVHGALMYKERSHDSAVDQKDERSFNFEQWKMLDPAYIEERWVHRAAQRPIMMSAAVSVMGTCTV